MLNVISALTTLYLDVNTGNDYTSFIIDNKHYSEVDWSFIAVVYDKLGLSILTIVQQIGLWGAILSTVLLIIGLIVWQGNQRERTKVIKNVATLILVFVLLMSIVSWVSFFQKVTTFSTVPRI